jgi:hypothetical protein
MFPVIFLARWLSCRQSAACAGAAGLVSLVVAGEEITTKADPART